MNKIFHRIVNDQARVYYFLLFLTCLKVQLFNSSLFGDGKDEISESLMVRERPLDVFQSEIRENNYINALKKLFSASESRGGVVLDPENFPSIGIKIKTRMAPGLQVSNRFLDAVLDILRFRGYSSEQIFLADRDSISLKNAGFYSTIPKHNTYRNHLVFSSSDERYYHKEWYYDSSMPPSLHDRTKFFIDFPFNRERRLQEERKSYLPSLLFLKNVFWINLAVVVDSINIGIDGAAANVTTGAISNYNRFLDRGTIAPATVTEILAIPELWDKRTYSIIDLSRFQFANGGQFDAEFIAGVPLLLLSENPISLDRVVLPSLNKERKKMGLAKRNEEDLLLFKYASEIGLGDVKNAKVFNVK
jgi:hypothetical protein